MNYVLNILEASKRQYRESIKKPWPEKDREIIEKHAKIIIAQIDRAIEILKGEQCGM